jgi:hypothetical protein
MKPVEINGRKDVGNLGFDDIGLGKQLDFAASDARVHLQLTRSGDEILLQHLHDTNARSGAGGSAHNSRARDVASPVQPCRPPIRGRQCRKNCGRS